MKSQIISLSVQCYSPRDKHTTGTGREISRIGRRPEVQSRNRFHQNRKIQNYSFLFAITAFTRMHFARNRSLMGSIYLSSVLEKRYSSQYIFSMLSTLFM